MHRHYFAHVALLSVAAVSFFTASPAYAASGPRITIVRNHWKSSTGACTADVAHASVTGVRADVRARIDGLLARTLHTITIDESGTSFADETPGASEAACATAIRRFAPFVTSVGRPYGQTRSADWTVGLAAGRWLSARAHATGFNVGAAHPWDTYQTITFDLAHGGYPVPKSGFYLASQRSTLNARLFDAEMAEFKAEGVGDLSDPDSVASFRAQAQTVNVDASQILVTPTGIEITSFLGAEAARNMILKVSFAKLQGVGTMGGPLDASTR